MTCPPPRPPFADPVDGHQVVQESPRSDDEVDSFDNDVETISVGFYESCFSKANFNAYSFISDCHSLFKQSENKTNHETSFLKAKVMSNVMRKLFVELSLTKQQMDKLNRFLKAVILCLTPENEKMAEHIHAGYLSCTRDSARRVAEDEATFEQSFLSCEHFALAFDTALFDQEHVLSCIIRFTFHDTIEQRPLFLRTCTSSTGEDLATFIYNELCRMNVPFNKLAT